MPDGSEQTVVKVLSGIRDVDADAWNACAGNSPFLSHAFLSALEVSECVGAEEGWLPQHLLIENENGVPVAAAPLYLKNHSYGEYVFDWGWADAFHRAGGDYYPKLLSAIPFTPVMGSRLLVHPDIPADKRTSLQLTLLSAMSGLAERLEASSAHVNFVSHEEWNLSGRAGWLQRIDRQFHWLNEGYRDFDGFLGALSSRKRKAIRKERRSVHENGVNISTLTGAEIREEHWDAFFRFYRNTSARKWGQAYLNRQFFSLLGEHLSDNILLVMAEKDGAFVGGALNLMDNDTLYGRYWGCLQDFRYLHFEVCYYQAIDFAIKRGLSKVEAGAQGEHKLQRGYLPHPTYSVHWISNPRFREAVSHFLEHEQAAIRDEIEGLGAYSPFRQEEN